MFDIGFLELVLLAGLGLIVLGPKRLPEVAAQLGRWVGQARRMSRTLMYQLRQEVNLDDPRPFTARGPSTAGARKTSGSKAKKPASGETAKDAAHAAKETELPSGSAARSGEAGPSESEAPEAETPQSEAPKPEAPHPEAPQSATSGKARSGDQ